MATLALSIPVGSWHPLFPAALRSLAQQPRGALRLALLDASGDERVREAAAASGLDFEFVRTGPDGGQAAAIAEGWAALESDWVGWLNSDDLLMPDAVTALLEALKRTPEADALVGDSVVIDAHGALKGVHGQVAAPTSALYRSNCISQPSCIVRRAAVEAVGGLNQSLHFVMDWDLWIRLHRDGAQFAFLDRHLSAVHWGEGTKTSQRSGARMREFFTLVARHAGAPAMVRAALGLMTESWPRLFSALAGRGSATAEAGLRLAADGNPREVPRLSADLPLINTSDRPVRRGRVGFSGDAAKLEAAHGLTVTHAGPGDWRFEADAPVQPGEARSIRMICPDGHDALASARWCE